MAVGCSSPSSPTPPPPPPPPPPEAPLLLCQESVARGTINNDGLAITFQAPEATRGQSPVTVACSPESGSTFPIGLTTVTCTATDALERQATCQFNVTVTKLPQLSRLRYMAFGDSITAGEVTFPGSTASLRDDRQTGSRADGRVSDGARKVVAVALSIPGRPNHRGEPGPQRRIYRGSAEPLFLGDGRDPP